MLALIVALFLPIFSFAEEIDLRSYETSLYSENGEDGVLARIFYLINPSTHFCVEIGCGDGKINSSTCLLRSQGWSSILFDRAYDDPKSTIFKEFVTAENINTLFTKYNIPLETTVLCFDTKYNDFYLWKALNEKYKPAVVVMRYNASYPVNEDKIVKYHPYYCGDHTNYFGASILALYRLGRSKGYSLLYAEQTGHRLFFIRDEMIGQLSFKKMNLVEELYRPPQQKIIEADPENLFYQQFVSTTELDR